MVHLAYHFQIEQQVDGIVECGPPNVTSLLSEAVSNFDCGMGNTPTIPTKERLEEQQQAEVLDKACQEAAALILDADVFILATGAGFSKDSGLAVYKVLLPFASPVFACTNT